MKNDLDLVELTGRFLDRKYDGAVPFDPSGLKINGTTVSYETEIPFRIKMELRKEEIVRETVVADALLQIRNYLHKNRRKLPPFLIVYDMDDKERIYAGRLNPKNLHEGDLESLKIFYDALAALDLQGNYTIKVRVKGMPSKGSVDYRSVQVVDWHKTAPYLSRELFERQAKRVGREKRKIELWKEISRAGKQFPSATVGEEEHFPVVIDPEFDDFQDDFWYSNIGKGLEPKDDG